MKRSILVTGLLLLPLVRLLDADPWLWPAAGLAALLALTSGGLRALLVSWRLPILISVIGALSLTALWARFWVLDLHEARFRWVLLGPPILAVAGSAFTSRAWGARLGAAIGLSSVLVLMLMRSDNGCTGVSPVYGQTLGLTGLILFSLGPWWVLPGLDDS